MPIKTWTAEQSKLIAEKFALCEEYYNIKDDVRNVEVLRKGAENMMSGYSQEKQLVQTTQR